MAVACDSASLMAAAKCFSCLTPKQQLQVMCYLSAVLNGSATDKNGVSALLAASKCFVCLSTVQMQIILAYEWCSIGVAVGA